MTRRMLAAALTLIGFAIVACGGGGSGDGSMSATCSPAGSAVRVTAVNNVFEEECLAAPADTAFTIELVNRDPGILHNVVITTKHNGGTTLFDGKLFAGNAAQTYQVAAIEAGVYHFHCEIHAGTMAGAFVVQ